MFGGAYVVDDFSLVLKALFLLSGYVVVLLSTNYIAEGDYWEGEYYSLMLCVDPRHDWSWPRPATSSPSSSPSSCSRSRPTCWPAWRKRDLKSNEAGLKYYLMGVFASAVMLYGMSLLYGVTGIDAAGRHRRAPIAAMESVPAPHARHRVRDHRLRLQGLGRAVPHLGARHLRGCADTGHRLPGRGVEGGRFRGPDRSWSSSASTGRADVFEPLMWVLAAALDDRRQPDRAAPDQHRPHAGLLGHRPGRLHAGPARGRRAGTVGSTLDDAVVTGAIVTYLVIYAAMNLGAFAVIIAVARKTRSAEIDVLRRAVPVRPGAHGRHDGLPLLAWPASRRSAAGTPSSASSSSLVAPNTASRLRARRDPGASTR